MCLRVEFVDRRFVTGIVYSETVRWTIDCNLQPWGFAFQNSISLCSFFKNLNGQGSPNTFLLKFSSINMESHLIGSNR